MLVAAPADEIAADIRRFALALAATFAALGLLLGVSTLLQIRFGLRPLARLRAAVVAIRRGESETVSAGLSPRHRAARRRESTSSSARTATSSSAPARRVGNLAHALKTPLSVVMNEADAHPGPLAEVVRAQAETMRGQVTYHLDRARAAAQVGTLGTVTPVAPVAASLMRVFAKIHADKRLDLALDAPEEARFRGDKQDLEENARQPPRQRGEMGARRGRPARPLLRRPRPAAPSC